MTIQEIRIGDKVQDRDGFEFEVVALFKDGTVYCDFEGNEADVWEFKVDELNRIVNHNNVTHLLTILDQMIKEENEALSNAGFYNQHKRETHADNKYCLAIVKLLIERRFRNSR